MKYEGKTYSLRFLFRDKTIFNLPGSGLYDRKEGERQREGERETGQIGTTAQHQNRERIQVYFRVSEDSDAPELMRDGFPCVSPHDDGIYTGGIFRLHCSTLEEGHVSFRKREKEDENELH